MRSNYSSERTLAGWAAVVSYGLCAATAAQLKRYAAMTHKDRWSTEDFDKMSWHDVHVHALRIVKNDEDTGTADIVFDIDYILEWRQDGGSFKFVVARAELKFHEASDLKLALDYVENNAGMCAFSIDGIERRSITFPNGYTSYRWRMEVNWPSGFVEFQSPGFTQLIVGQHHVQGSPWLTPSQRSVGGAA